MDPDEWTLSKEYNMFSYDDREISGFHFSSGQREWLHFFFNICCCTGSESWDNSSLLQHSGVVINTLNDDYQETLLSVSWFFWLFRSYFWTLNTDSEDHSQENTKFLSSNRMTTYLKLRWELWLSNMSTVF